MAIQTINIGNNANDGAGDPARSAFNKINQNFTNNAHAASRLVGLEAGNVMQVGAFGLGGNSQMYNNGVNGFLDFYKNKSGFFFNNTFNVYVNGKKLPNFCSYVVSSFFGGGFFSIGASVTTNEVFVIRGSDVPAYPIELLYLLHNGNTTVDANGFIKAASPIAKLFADKIEPNNEAAEQNIVFQKIDVGHYLIKGSSGFAQEGWYIETPKDANGNILFAVNYEQLENGDIEVKTYKKKFDLESASIVADLENPVDITLNRWIDIRLQEVPKPAPEIPSEDEEVNSDEPQQ